MKKRHIHHIHIIILLGFIFFTGLLIYINIAQEKFLLSGKVTFGVSFTPEYAKSLGLDPKKTYSSLLNDLKVNNFRLSAYWDEIEPKKDQFNFSELDYYIEEAEKKDAQVILAVGYKLPRWPECRAPGWVETEELRDRQLVMLEKVITYYGKNPTVTAFQLENEPLLAFGECPQPDRTFLKKEVEFVRNLTKKPIIITDTGELRPWKTPMQLGDIFGTTMYRIIDTPWVGIFQYPLRPWFYRVKSDLIRTVFASDNQKTIISELQTEPWVREIITNIPISDQAQRFNVSQFKETVDFAKKTGFPEVYFWGVEWWYYMEANGHPEYLNYAKSIF